MSDLDQRIYLIENMPVLIDNNMSERDIELVARGHRQAREWAVSLLRLDDPSAPVVVDG